MLYRVWADILSCFQGRNNGGSSGSPMTQTRRRAGDALVPRVDGTLGNLAFSLAAIFRGLDSFGVLF